MNERVLEIIRAGRRRVFNLAFAHVNAAVARPRGISLDAIDFIHVQSIFQRRQRDDGFENGAGLIIFIRRAVLLRLQILQLLVFLPRNALCKIVRVERRRRRHRQHVAQTHVHHHHRGLRFRAPTVFERILGGALKIEVQGQHEVLAGLRLGVHVSRLAVAHVVDEHGFLAGAAMQLGVVFAFDARHAAIIRQPIVEKGFLAFVGTVVLPQLAQQMRRRGAKRITAQGLEFQIRAQPAGIIFLKARDPASVEILQDGKRHRQLRRVMPLEFHRVKRQRLAHLAADVRDDPAGDLRSRLRPQRLQILRFERELFPLRLGQRAAQFFFPRGDFRRSENS